MIKIKSNNLDAIQYGKFSILNLSTEDRDNFLKYIGGYGFKHPLESLNFFNRLKKRTPDNDKDSHKKINKLIKKFTNIISNARPTPNWSPDVVEIESIVGSDKRSIAANDIYNNKKRQLLIPKTTRAGATTSFVAESLNRGLKVLVIAPTTKIGTQVVNDAIEYSNFKDAKYVRFAPKTECNKIRDLKLAYPELENLPYISSGVRCEECDEYFKCDVVKILNEDSDVSSITFAKLKKIFEMGELNPTEDININKLLIDKLVSFDTYILDEWHEALLPEFEKIQLFQLDITSIENLMENSIKWRTFNFKKFSNESITSEHILSEIVNKFKFICNDKYINEKCEIGLKNAFNKIKNEADKNKEKPHLVIDIHNPFPKTGSIDELKAYKTIQQKIMDEKITGAVGKELFQMLRIVNHDKLKLTQTWTWKEHTTKKQEQIKELYKSKGKKAGENSLRYKSELKYWIGTMNNLPLELFKEFMKEMCYDDKRVYFTSATVTDIISISEFMPAPRIKNQINSKIEILENPKIESSKYPKPDLGILTPKINESPKFNDTIVDYDSIVNFGELGDPMKTNSKLHIFTDSWTLSFMGRYSLGWTKRMKIIVDDIKSIVKLHGEENIMIVVPNTISSDKLQSTLKKNGINIEVDYYKSENTIGVKCDKRIMIAIGIAQKPINAYDVYTPNADDSMRMRDWGVSADTWQTISRVKDPNGKQESFVYFIGVKWQEGKNISNWNVHQNIPESSKPMVYDRFFLKSTRKLRIKSKHNDGSQYLLSQNSQKVPIDSIGTNWVFSDKMALLVPLCEIIAIRSSTNKEMRNTKNIPIEDLITEHLNGTKILSVPRLNKDKTVNFITYEFGLKDIGLMLFNYFQKTNKTIIEDFGDNFRMWIFFDKPIPANDAKKLGKVPMKLFKLTKEDIQLYPKITARFNKKDLIRLPFSPIKKAK